MVHPTPPRAPPLPDLYPALTSPSLASHPQQSSFYFPLAGPVSYPFKTWARCTLAIANADIGAVWIGADGCRIKTLALAGAQSTVWMGSNFWFAPYSATFHVQFTKFIGEARVVDSSAKILACPLLAGQTGAKSKQPHLLDACNVLVSTKELSTVGSPHPSSSSSNRICLIFLTIIDRTSAPSPTAVRRCYRVPPCLSASRLSLEAALSWNCTKCVSNPVHQFLPICLN